MINHIVSINQPGGKSDDFGADVVGSWEQGLDQELQDSDCQTGQVLSMSE